MNTDLKNYLATNKISVNEFAESLGVTKQTVYGWVKGHGDLSYKNIVKIAKLYPDYPMGIDLNLSQDTSSEIQDIKNSNSPINIPTEAIESWKMVEEAYKMRIEHLEGEVLYYRSVIDTLLKR